MLKTANPNAMLLVELTDQAAHILKYSFANKIKPMACVIVLQSGDQWLGAALCIYAAQTEPDPRGLQSMPLTPFFYPYEVATALVSRGILVEEHTSQKTGIQVHWCRVIEPELGVG